MEAWLYEVLDDKKVRCGLCHHRCIIQDKNRGICRVRENRSGVLETLVYGRLIARHVDPIEKKPLFHFLPGSLSYSIATAGCNFKCLFCQNADISQISSNRSPSAIGGYCDPQEVLDSSTEEKCQRIA